LLVRRWRIPLQLDLSMIETHRGIAKI
jgi:hypothetical protein